jgi:hypothetical protein
MQGLEFFGVLEVPFSYFTNWKVFEDWKTFWINGMRLAGPGPSTVFPSSPDRVRPTRPKLLKRRAHAWMRSRPRRLARPGPAGPEDLRATCWPLRPYPLVLPHWSKVHFPPLVLSSPSRASRTIAPQVLPSLPPSSHHATSTWDVALWVPPRPQATGRQESPKSHNAIRRATASTLPLSEHLRPSPALPRPPWAPLRCRATIPEWSDRPMCSQECPRCLPSPPQGPQ